MKSIATPITIEWEDCDPAGIVYYPKFFNYFDRGSWNLFVVQGLTLEAMRGEFGAMGIPVVDARDSFLSPCRFKHEVQLVTTMEKIGGKSFTLSHVIHNGVQVAVRGQEVRVWGFPHPEDPDGLQAGAIPRDIAARFGD